MLQSHEINDGHILAVIRKKFIVCLSAKYLRFQMMFKSDKNLLVLFATQTVFASL